MQLHPRVTSSTLDLVAGFEGLRLRAARLEDGRWTVGHGHVRTAREGAEVSPADARALLAWDLSRTAELIDATVSAPLDAHQFDALASFAFDLGEEAFRGSQVPARLNEGRFLQAAAAFEPWRRADLEDRSPVVDALVRRRAAEKARFLNPVEGAPAAPSPTLRPRVDPALDRPAAAAESAMEVVAPLDGDGARARLADPAPPSASSAVVDALAERLDRIVPDVELPPVRAAGFVPPAPAQEAEPPPPLATAERAFASAPPPPPADGRAPFPGTRPQPHPAMPAPAAHPRRRALPSWIATGTIYAAIALIGLVLFGAALVCILDRATFGCLLVGVLGVVFMIPYLLRLFAGPRPRR